MAAINLFQWHYVNYDCELLSVVTIGDDDEDDEQSREAQQQPGEAAQNKVSRGHS